VNAPKASDDFRAAGVIGSTPGLRAVVTRLAQNARSNLERWLVFIAAPPPIKMLRPHMPAAAAALAALYLVFASMFLLDAAASDWANHLPQWIKSLFESITNFGLSGWFLIPFGLVLLCLAAVISPSLPRISRDVLIALAARSGFVFLAIGLPGLFDTIVKRMIGRARPTVGGHDDPFHYMPFIWRPEYASMPSGHATTAAAAAVAIGAIWPRTQWAMWLYALVIMLSRVIVQAHHPSDVLAGGVVGAAGAYLLRRWFAGRRVLFCPRDLRPYPGPSLRRIAAASRDALRILRTPH
jgi:undecaprenyl-diphosphatase